MLTLKSFRFNPFSENTYLWINENKECWITDPGMYGAEEESELTSYIEQNGLKPQQIINTHGHIDHIFAVDALKAKYNIPFGIHELETPVLNNAVGSAMMFGFKFNVAPVPDFYLTEGQVLQLGEDEVEVRLAPGHSPGSVVFYYPAGNFAVSGDVLFQESVGRSDLPGGNHDVLMESISKQLYTLPNDTIIYSGHGPATTIGHEKQNNPFVRG